MNDSKREYLTELRNKKGLSQEEVAKLIDVARSTYACYETGDREPNLETMGRIAKVLGEKDLVKLFRKGGIIIANNNSQNGKKD